MKLVTTTIGKLNLQPRPDRVEAYLERNSLKEEFEAAPMNPYDITIHDAVLTFLSAGIMLPSTGQTRADMWRLFLDPTHVSGIKYDGAKIHITGKIKRKSPLRLADVLKAKGYLWDYAGEVNWELKEPLTGPYSLSQEVELHTGHYSSRRELAFSLAKDLLNPEALQLEKETSILQFDEPYFARGHYPRFAKALYEELTAGLKKKVVGHFCGDTVRLFTELRRLPLNGLLLDFLENPELTAEVARRDSDATIGLGCVRVHKTLGDPADSVEAITARIEKNVRKLGEDRVEFVHPVCGQGSTPLGTAHQDLTNLVIARDEYLEGNTKTAQLIPLEDEEFDKTGYFRVQTNGESNQIIVTLLKYRTHEILGRWTSDSGEKLWQTIFSDRRVSPRHMSHLAYELGEAEVSLKNKIPYRQRII
jgi:methionine synthase II (cobalamin-independent)